MVSKSNNKLVEQQDALGAFFDSLMRDVEAFAEAEEAPSEPIAPAKVAPRPALVDTTSKPVEVQVPAASIYETLPPVAPPAVDLVAKQDIPEAAVLAKPELPEPPQEPDAAQAQSLAPAWIGQELQAMLFKVAGLTLAVPLVDLSGVVEWDEEKVAEMPGHADFYLGLMSHLNRQIPVVDTACLVLPENKRKQLAGEDPRKRITRVVLINGSRYGLACDEVNEVVTLKADAVRWRSERTQRRWLAGTVIEHMCALVDATAFAELLAGRASVNAFRE